ncbi:MAG: hypothetical protein VCC00_00665 [Deltaproteobacteria bacterium]
MNRRSPIQTLAVFAVVGLVALLATPVNAQDNIYKNFGGLGSVAGPTLNPGGQGQVLYGGYYDVRSVNGDAQHNNLQIVNTNTNDASLPVCSTEDFDAGIAGEDCYDVTGGILAKVRFRAAMDSEEVLDFVIALSCGEVWAGAVQLSGNGMPFIRSDFPVYDVGSTVRPALAVTTSRGFAGGYAFPGALGVTADDMSRGSIEVIAMESLFCEPDAGALSPSGVDTWTRLGTMAGSNALSGVVFQVRAAAGVSYAYNMDAISRFANGGSLAPEDLLAANEPNATDCDVAGLSEEGCLAAISLALSKSRVVAQYDIEAGTSGSTNIVLTLPNKHLYCAGGGANGPFQCDAAGEQVGVELYDRRENFAAEGDARLPYEVTVVSITADGLPRGNADIAWQPGVGLSMESGWLTIDLTRNFDGVLVHEESDASLSVLGMPVDGYRGLPTIALVLQEFISDATAAGSTYGSTVAAGTSQQVLLGDPS